MRRQAAWGVKAPETAIKSLMASDDDGGTWEQVGWPAPLHWPSIFRCASGAPGQATAIDFRKIVRQSAATLAVHLPLRLGFARSPCFVRV